MSSATLSSGATTGCDPSGDRFGLGGLRAPQLSSQTRPIESLADFFEHFV